MLNLLKALHFSSSTHKHFTVLNSIKTLFRLKSRNLIRVFPSNFSLAVSGFAVRGNSQERNPASGKGYLY